MKIINYPSRLITSNIKENVFLVLIDYEDETPSLYGKSVKQTIYSFKDLTKAKNFQKYEKSIINQIPFYSFDLIDFRLQRIWKWILKKF
jgi:hypothetical protein